MLPYVWLLLASLNLIAVFLYGYDKLQARRNGRRVRERTLLLMIFLGAWQGAWLAMGMFRHKTVKTSFRVWAMLWTVVTPFWPIVYWTFRELELLG